jgi:hypothetical protein
MDDPGAQSLNVALAYGMDEIRVCRRVTRGTHIGCDLPPMINRVHQDVLQDV